MKNSLEGIVIKWTDQVNKVLEEDSKIAFENNRNPPPSAEIEFWDQRMKNLENIYVQLRDPRAKQIGCVLQAIDSVYYTSFRNTFKNVVASLHEARDITLWLKPLVSLFPLLVSE